MSSGSLGYAWVDSGEPARGLVDSCSRGFTRADLLIVVFIRVRMGSIRRTNGHRVYPVTRGKLRPQQVRPQQSSRGVFNHNLAVAPALPWVHSGGHRRPRLFRVGSLGGA